MSIVYITKHNESIYNTKCVQDTTKCETTQLKVRSDPLQILTKIRTSEPRRKNRVSGRVKKPSDASHFLRKGSGKPALNPKQKGFIRKRPLTTPPVPTREFLFNLEKDRKERLPRDITQENIDRIQTMAAKEPQRILMDSSGRRRTLAPKDGTKIASEKFGKLPHYVEKLIKIKERAEVIKKQTPDMQPKCRYITRNQKGKLLKGLKTNWQELQSQYQLLPILTDTIPKIIRKSKMEAELNQLEKDIVLIERHPYIYVYNDEIE